MASDTRCRTVLLSDVPSKEDQFDGRHEKVADAIHELITTEDGGKTIGLEGPWGSGKSTVVGMVTPISTRVIRSAYRSWMP